MNQQTFIEERIDRLAHHWGVHPDLVDLGMISTVLCFWMDTVRKRLWSYAAFTFELPPIFQRSLHHEERSSSPTRAATHFFRFHLIANSTLSRVVG